MEETPTIPSLLTFPSLTKVRVQLAPHSLTGRCAAFLSSICSAPELSSVTFSFAAIGVTSSVFLFFAHWAVVDKWLAQMALTPVTGKAKLRVMLAGWPEDNPNWEGFFPEFRRAGGELRREIFDYGYWNPRTVFNAECWINASKRVRKRGCGRMGSVSSPPLCGCGQWDTALCVKAMEILFELDLWLQCLDYGQSDLAMLQ